MLSCSTAAATTRASEDDLELARRCARGDEPALRLVFEAHEPSLRRLLFRIVRNMGDAEELSADVFVRFWKSAGRYRGDCSLRAYLTRIALNLGRDRLRRQPSHLGRVGEERAGEGAIALAPAVLSAEIEEAMARLEDGDREVLTLYYLDELTYDEIGAALGISYDVLRTRLVRARKRLRALLGVEE